MRSMDARRFEQRHNRGLTSQRPGESAPPEWGHLPCVACGARTLSLLSDLDTRCFDCKKPDNAFAAKNIRCSVDAAGDDSKDPKRIKDGTAGFNVALPPVTERTGERDAYGYHKVRGRMVSNNEITSSRKLKEMAKRANLTPLETSKRAVG